MEKGGRVTSKMAETWDWVLAGFWKQEAGGSRGLFQFQKWKVVTRPLTLSLSSLGSPSHSPSISRLVPMLLYEHMPVRVSRRSGGASCEEEVAYTR